MVRRIVTGLDSDGKPAILSDGPSPESASSAHVAGMGRELIWATASPVAPGENIIEGGRSLIPAPGESIAMVISFPSASAFAVPGLDFAAVGAETAALFPGLAERFEAEDPAMHRTASVDYSVVLQGPIVLDLGDDRAVELATGDIVVQNATRHAWRTVGDLPATLFVVLLGADDTAT
jgi:hypothetical protein